MLIVARYNEDISWVKPLNIPHIIYNKGEEILDKTLNIKTLSNIGRESNTYINYIIEHYNNLPENIIFSQGNPFPHCHNFIELIKNYEDNDSILNLSHWIVTEDLEGRPHAYGYGMVPMLETLNIPLTVSNFIFPAGAQFIINKRFILNKPLSWWEEVLYKHDKNELSPWIFERLWPLIFNYSCI
jgi:hypothetical protein